MLDGAAIADETLAQRRRRSARADRARRDAGSRGRSGRRESGEPELCRRQGQGRQGVRLPFDPAQSVGRRRAKPSCWRWSRRSTPIRPCMASSCNCRCPKPIDSARVLEAIAPAKDVDGFHPINVGLLSIGDTRRALIPCTPAGAMILIDKACERLGWTLPGMEAVIIGRSNIVGKPMAQLLLARHCTVTIAHSRTRDLPSVARRADILVAAVGQPEMVRGDWVKPGAIVIDVGINRVPARRARRVGQAQDASRRRRRLCGGRRGRRRDHARARRRRSDDHRHADGEHGSGGEKVGGAVSAMATKKDDAASRPDDESPEWTRKDFERARPALSLIGEVFGADAAQAVARRSRSSAKGKPEGQSNAAPSMRTWSMPTRRQGRGWQTAQFNALLRAHMNDSAQIASTSAPSRHDIRCGGSSAAPRRCRCSRPDRPRHSPWRPACPGPRRT